MFSRTEVTDLEKEETLAEQSFEQQVSDICVTHRAFLAALRKDAK